MLYRMDPKRLLIVDDDVAMSRVLERSFSRADFHVETVTSGEHALERVRDTSFDVVITDARGRRPTGREFTERLRRAGGPKPYVFVLTSRSGPEERRWIERVARAELVEKPVGPRTLVRLVSSRMSLDDNADGDRERVA